MATQIYDELTPDAAALLAVLEELRSGENKLREPPLNESNSGIMPDGGPPSTAGAFYISIDETGVTNPGQPEQDHLAERTNLSIWVSRRITVPRDRRANPYLQQLTGVSALERKIIEALHGNWNVVAHIDRMLPSSQEYNEPLWFAGRGKMQTMGPDWSGETDGNGWAVREVRFVGLRRLQCISLAQQSLANQ